VVGLDSVMC